MLVLIKLLYAYLIMVVDELTDAEHIAASKCLASFLLIKPKKKKVDDQSMSPYTAIPFLLVDAPVCFPLYFNSIIAKLLVIFYHI